MPLLSRYKPRGLIASPPEPTLALEAIRQAERAYQLRFPDDYRDLAQECIGFRCRFPNGCELELWPFTELEARDDSYAINELAPMRCMIAPRTTATGLRLNDAPGIVSLWQVLQRPPDLRPECLVAMWGTSASRALEGNPIVVQSKSVVRPAAN